MSNIIKQNEIRATLALAIVSIAFAELSAHSPESSRPVLVIIATALGMAALYPLFLLLQRPRRYRITKVTEGYETVYIIRYKGYLWWYNATLSNGKTIAFKSMEEAMQYIKENVVMSMINRKTKQKSIKRESTVMYDSIKQGNNPDTSDTLGALNSNGAETDNSANATQESGSSTNDNPDSPQQTNAANDNKNADGNPATANASESSTSKNTETKNVPNNQKTSDTPMSDNPQNAHTPGSSDNSETEANNNPTPSGSSKNTGKESTNSPGTTDTPAGDSQEPDDINSKKQKIPPSSKTVIQATAFLNAVATKQQEDDETPTPDTKEKTESETTPVPTNAANPAEKNAIINEDSPEEVENNNDERPTTRETTNTYPQTPTPENPQNPEHKADLRDAFFNVMDSFNNKNKRKQTHKKAAGEKGKLPKETEKADEKKDVENTQDEAVNEPDNKETGNKEVETPHEETIAKTDNMEVEHMDEENLQDNTPTETSTPQTQGKNWTQMVGEMRLSHGSNPALVTGSLAMIHQHRILKQEKMESSQNADKDAPDSETTLPSAQRNELQNNSPEDKPKEKIKTKTIKTGGPSAEQRYLTSKRKANQKQRVKQTSLYDLKEFNAPMEEPHGSPATDTKNDNVGTAPTDPPDGEPTSSDGHKIAKKPETAPPPSQENTQAPGHTNTEPPSENTNEDFRNGSEGTAEEPTDTPAPHTAPIQQPSEENLTAEDDEVDYGYTESEESPNVIIVEPPYPADDTTGDKDDLPI